MKPKSNWLKETIARRDRVIKQMDICQQQLDAYNVILNGANKSEKKAKTPEQSLPLFESQSVGRRNSLVSSIWNLMKDEQGTFGVKEVRPKLETLGRKARSSMISAALKQLYERKKLILITAGKSRWNPSKYSVNRAKQGKGGEQS